MKKTHEQKIEQLKKELESVPAEKHADYCEAYWSMDDDSEYDSSGCWLGDDDD